MTQQTRQTQQTQDGRGGGQTLTVLYDGNCGFCTRQARLAQRVVGARRVRLVSTAAPGTLAQFAGLTQGATSRQLHVQDASGRRWGGAAAVARLVRALPIVGALGWLYYLPGIRQVADLVYGWFSRNRYAISRRLGWDLSTCDGACALPGSAPAPAAARAPSSTCTLGTEPGD